MRESDKLTVLLVCILRVLNTLAAPPQGHLLVDINSAIPVEADSDRLASHSFRQLPAILSSSAADHLELTKRTEYASNEQSSIAALTMEKSRFTKKWAPNGMEKLVQRRARHDRNLIVY